MSDIREVKEGFLCPFCLQDMGTMNRLQTHFRKQHSDEPKFNQLLRELYGRAKEIVNKSDSETKTSIQRQFLFSLEIYDTIQELGITRSYMEKFIELRNQRLEGFAAETNQLIIRLDKILMNMPSDPSKRKREARNRVYWCNLQLHTRCILYNLVHEQTIVPWIDAEEVLRCPECTKNFHIARRKHHCRLCGSIMCHDCSYFLPINEAKMILSLNETPSSSESGLRICGYCLNLLKKKEQFETSRNHKPDISALYDITRSHVTDLNQKAKMFESMSQSLNEGKVMYHLSDAQNLWEKIMRLVEKIRAMSAEIASLNVVENSNFLTEKQMKLQKAVSMGINGYIQSRVMNLPTLPLEEEYNRLKEERSWKIKNEITRERQQEMMDALLASQVITEVIHSSRALQQCTQTIPSVNRGWVPEVGASRFNLVDDPLIEQMNNIRSFIKQAREACKYDEVEGLEDHLKELEEELYRQRS